MKLKKFIILKESGEIPEDLPVLLQALLLCAGGDWGSAHRIAQNVMTREGSWVHAYLHREEGDLGNAAYWYSQAGKKFPESDLEEEWLSIAKKLLERV